MTILNKEIHEINNITSTVQNINTIIDPKNHLIAASYYWLVVMLVLIQYYYQIQFTFI